MSVALSAAEADADPSELLLDALEVMLAVMLLPGADAPAPPLLLTSPCFNALWEIPLTSRTCYRRSSTSVLYQASTYRKDLSDQQDTENGNGFQLHGERAFLQT